MIKTRVLFLCTGNGCRTQMAEAFLRNLAGDHFDVSSAGYEEAPEICPDAIEAMRQLGVDITGQRPKKADQFLGQRFSHVVTVCDRQKEPTCPIFPGAIWRDMWPIENPLSQSSPEQRRVAVRQARDDIRSRVLEFISKNTQKENQPMEVKEIVKEKYGEAARRVASGGANGCCGASSALESCCDPITSNLYDAAQTSALPEEAVLASLGCGNPTALAELKAGETVLDLGSGGGIDVLLSARRVWPTGKAYGLDMTDDMLALARENQRKAGVNNVEFLKGEIEHIPLPDNSVDVIISNCVINLSGDKDRVLHEAFRVLKPGGRFAVSDVVTRGEVPEDVRQNMLLWVGCIAGALQDYQYVSKLAKAGFDDINIEPTRIYDVEDARTFLSGQGVDVDAIAPQVQGKFMSAFIRATKPVNCCAPGCCYS